MKTALRSLALLSSLAFGASALHAAEVSPGVAAMLADAAPKYAPQAAKPATNSAERERAEADKPRNGIIRLPSYIVLESRPPSFKDRELLTERGRLDLALKRYPGLRLGGFGPLNNNAWGAMMLEEDFALERMKEMYDLLSLLPANQRPQLMLYQRPGREFNGAYSGPTAGLTVPWERR